MKSNIQFRDAKKIDIERILEIQEYFLLPNQIERCTINEGFLVYPVSKEELERVIRSESCLCVVGESNGIVGGYGLTYDLKEWFNMSEKNNWDCLSELNIEKTLYFRHIARLSQFSMLGRNIEEEVFKQARNKEYKFVVGEILERPKDNVISRELHLKRGFVRVGSAKYDHEFVWGVYRKKLIL